MGLWLKIKELIRRVLPKKSVEEIFHAVPCYSDKMEQSIQLWSNMYEGHPYWAKEPSDCDPVRIVSLGLPAMIASEKARMVTLEMKSEITPPMQPVDNASQTQGTDNSAVNSNLNTESGVNVKDGMPSTISPSSAYQPVAEAVPAGPTERAEFLNKQYKKVLKQIRRQLEYGIAKGGLVIKPYIVMYDDTSNNSVQDSSKASSFTSETNNSNDKYNKTSENNNATNTTENATKATAKSSVRYTGKLDNAEIMFDYIQADRFFPLAFDPNGKIIEAVFVQTKSDKARQRVYIRLEHHKLERRKVTVQNLAFESTDMSLAESNNLKSATNLGDQIPLTAVPDWAYLQPITTIEGVDRLLFAYFRMPEANTIDPYSPLGVSGYSRVVQLIKDADMQYSRMLWEFEAGEMAIDVDRDALKFVENPDGTGRSVLPEKQSRLFRKVDLNNEETYEVFAPNLRDASIVHGMNTILIKIEDACGLSRGTLSDVTTQEAKTATELKILKQRSYATNADIQTALQETLEDLVYVMDVYCTLYDVTPYGEYNISFEWDDSIIVDSESELSKRITLMQNGLASKLENRMWYFGETENQARAALRQIDEESTNAMMQNIQAEMMKSKAGLTTDNEDEKSPSDTTSDKKSKGKQADSLKNPTKTQAARDIKNSEKS